MRLLNSHGLTVESDGWSIRSKCNSNRNFYEAKYNIHLISSTRLTQYAIVEIASALHFACSAASLPPSQLQAPTTTCGLCCCCSSAAMMIG